MTQQFAVVTPAPGAVFLRVSSPAIEMTPGQAVRLREELDRAIGIALAAHDGQALRHMLGGSA